MSDAISSPNPVIASIALVMPGSAKKILCFLISDITGFLNVGKTMDAAQILQTADLILRDLNFKNLKPDDFKVCFDNAKKGYYGKAYDRIDGQVICEWLSAYVAERSTMIEGISFDAHEKKKTSPNVIAPEIVEMYKEMARLAEEKKISNSGLVAVDIKIVDQEIDGKKVKYTGKMVGPKTIEQPVKPIKAIEKSPRDKFIQQCFAEFQQIFDKKPYRPPKKDPVPGTFINPDSAGRHILYEGTPVDEIEYTQIKLKEYDTLLP